MCSTGLCLLNPLNYHLNQILFSIMPAYTNDDIHVKSLTSCQKFVCNLENFQRVEDIKLS